VVNAMLYVACMKAVVRWVNFDRVNRQQFASQLIDCVRFPLMSIDQIIHHVEPAAAWLFTDADWKRLYEAMKYTVACSIVRNIMNN